MQKKLFLLSIALLSAICLWARSASMISFGLRGGGCTYMTTGNADSHIGGGGDFDLGYSCLWNTPNAEVGIHTGLSLGLCTNRFTGKVKSTFTNIDYLGNEIQYTVSSSSVRLNIIRQVQLEIPLMLALRTENMFINIGAKFMMPISDKYEQSMGDLTIDAYYPKPDVHVVNRLITGDASSAKMDVSGNGCLPKYNVLLGLEIGYEWNIQDTHRIGLGFYADISPWSSFKRSDASEVVSVSPIVNPDYPPAEVTIQPICKASVDEMLYCDFGVKVYYGLNIIIH